MWGWDILQDVCQIAYPNQTVNICHFLEDISAPQTRINLPIAALELCCKADRFEYNKAYIWEYFLGLKGGQVDFWGLVGKDFC